MTAVPSRLMSQPEVADAVAHLSDATLPFDDKTLQCIRLLITTIKGADNILSCAEHIVEERNLEHGVISAKLAVVQNSRDQVYNLGVKIAEENTALRHKTEELKTQLEDVLKKYTELYAKHNTP